MRGIIAAAASAVFLFTAAQAQTDAAGAGEATLATAAVDARSALQTQDEPVLMTAETQTPAAEEGVIDVGAYGFSPGECASRGAYYHPQSRGCVCENGQRVVPPFERCIGGRPVYTGGR
ncbi:MAG: hypothetical protein HY059_09220 [Proteobacteria bacterium]|nr:hypothetical protein [Pseudomonadota bacterium]